MYVWEMTLWLKSTILKCFLQTKVPFRGSFIQFFGIWPTVIEASFFQSRPNRFEPNEVEHFSLFMKRDSWNNHLVKCQHQSSISSLLWPAKSRTNEQQAGFYELNKCVQHFTIENKGKIRVTAASAITY